MSRTVEAPAAKPSRLLVRGDPAADTLVAVTPEQAGWRYVGFSAHRIAAGAALAGNTGERELCAVLLGGRCAVETGDRRFEDVGGRASPFDGPPHAVYLPPRTAYRIVALGGAIRFDCRVEDLDLADGSVRGLSTSAGPMAAEVVLLAIGHSARDTLAMLVRRGVPMVQKPFQFGVRIEQPQDIVNRVKYGPAPLELKLGAADYNLVARGKPDLFSFCMCAGGNIIPSVSEEGYFCTNGMSLSGRDTPFANSGLVVTIPLEHFPGADVLAGVRLQQQYEQRAFALGRGEYHCPIQGARDFLAGRRSSEPPACSYPRGLVSADIADLVPPVVLEALQHGLPILDRRWRGRFLQRAYLVGPEARGSSPVRMLRDESTRAAPGIEGLYPVGEGAGYAGGIVSAAVDGLRSAMAVIAKYAPLG